MGARSVAPDTRGSETDPPVPVRAQRLSGRREVGQGHVDFRVAAPQAGAQVIQGFDVRFLNGDHHFGRFAVNKITAGARVAFSDQNSDDPVAVNLNLLVIDPLP